VNDWTDVAGSDFMFRVVEDPAGDYYYIDGSYVKFLSTAYALYYYTSIKDLGYICDAKIIIDTIVAVTQGAAYNTEAVRRYNTDSTMRYTGQSLPVGMTYEIRTSEDNITWTDWEDWILADYHCRYFQVKLTLTREFLTSTIIFSSFIIKADLPDVDENITGTISVAGTGATITFTKTYHAAPSVNVQILSGDGYVVKFTTAPTLTGCAFKVYQLDGTAVVGDYMVNVHGY